MTTTVPMWRVAYIKPGSHAPEHEHRDDHDTAELAETHRATLEAEGWRCELYRVLVEPAEVAGP